ncbi:MAG: hypothetical protein M1838_000566, partial [Thelocarpon superellum]
SVERPPYQEAAVTPTSTVLQHRAQGALSDDLEGSSTPGPSNANDRWEPQPLARLQRSTHISRRTASAILYALEEAIRTPFPFTPDLNEETASMSDLLGSGASKVASSNVRGTSNGASRAPAPAPAPVSTSAPAAQYSAPGVRGPRDIMRERQAREARRKAEIEAKEKEQDDEDRRRGQEDRRRSAERRAAAVGVAEGRPTAGTGDASDRRPSGGPGATANPAGPLYAGERRAADRLSGSVPSRTTSSRVPPATAAHLPPDRPPAETSIPRASGPGGGGDGPRMASGPSSRARVPSASQPAGRSAPGQVSSTAPDAGHSQPPPRSQHRPAPVTAQSSQAQAGISAAPSSSQPTQGGQASEGQPSRNPTASSFPHAFERWETLSSHWEGLTSYWIRRLEQNSDEVRQEPLAQQMSRQITDLSAAGANLFHAVVELQRLRASSERKFQRWFFETRAEQERAAELQGELETNLRRERAQRVEALALVTRAEKARSIAETMVEEMKRELQISKEEARRAWEELGRREQEEIERTRSLREGIPTLVGGVQVVPTGQGGLSRHGSVNQPPTREGAGASEASRTGPASQTRAEQYGREGAEAHGGYAPYASDSGPRREEAYVDTARRGRSSSQSEREAASRPSQLPPTTSNGAVVTPNTRTANPPRSHAPFDPGVSASAAAPSSQGPSSRAAQFYQHSGTSIHEPEGVGATGMPERTLQSPLSEVATVSEVDFELDERGDYRLDPQGQRIAYRRGLASEGSDDYDVREDLERERAHAARYGAVSSSDYVPTSTATATATATAPAAGRGGGNGGGGGATWSEPGADYSGAQYGSAWENVSQHHHPTRLSGILEEDERSRTSASRASIASRR